MLTNNQILNLLANPSQAETVVNISIFLPNVIRLQFIQHIFCQVISNGINLLYSKEYVCLISLYIIINQL